MASIRKRATGKWIAEVRTRGHYRSKQFDAKYDAEIWAKEVEYELGQFHGIAKGRKMKDILAWYLREESPKKRGEKWERDRIQKIMRHPIADIPLVQLKPEDIERYLNDQQIKDASKLRDLHIISPVLNAAVRLRWLKESPMNRVRKPKAGPPRFRRITQEEINSILKELYWQGEKPTTGSQETAWAFLFAIETAMRQGEIWKLTADCVFNKYVHLPITKNGTARDVPLSPAARDLITKVELPLKIGQASGGVLFRRACKKAGIEGLTFHDTRHEAITRLARRVQVLDLARIVGHKQINQLMIYYNATAEELADLL